MRVSYQWLRELIPGLTASPKDVSKKLTDVGLELEEVVEFGAGLEPVVLAEVVSIARHPEREKLQLVTVSLGAGRTQTVVCGASNVPAPGGLVVLAPLGTYLPAIGLKLEPKKLGGIVSEGMLCSETELGLGADTGGILTFKPGTFAAGTPFREAFPTSWDTVFGIGVTPNRPDALGHRGVARDVAAAFGLDYVAKLPSFGEIQNQGPNTILQNITIENRAPVRCPGYAAALVEDVVVRPAPEWMRWRLFSLGVRPISNVVDITNLLMLEFGNPMHAFDLSQVRGQTLIIREAFAGETITTLDNQARPLMPNDLVIADKEHPSALAGIMGSLGSEIQETTRRVLLECAYFEPRGIRRTSRRLALSTDSSYRFERGVDAANLDAVLARASQLLAEVANGRFAGALRRDGELPQAQEITLRSERMNSLLGVEVPFGEAVTCLTRLGFKTLRSDPASASFHSLPSRPDVTLEADLIEEVARIRGLDCIPTVLPAIKPQRPTFYGRFERQIRELAAALGLTETVNYSFVSRKALQASLSPEPQVELLNPLTDERSVLTTSLLPGLLEVLTRAKRHGEANARLFTLGSSFGAPVTDGQRESAGLRKRDAAEVNILPHEEVQFAALLAGERPNYLTKAEPLDVYDAKGLALELIERLTGAQARVDAANQDDTLKHLHPRARGRIFVGETEVGLFGSLHPDVIDAFELSPATHYVELKVAALEQLGKLTPRYQAIARLPAVSRDIALEAPETLTAGSILETIRNSTGDLCESAELFDLFRGPGESKARSLAFRLVYRDPKASSDPEKARTLTDKEVDAQHQKVLNAVKQLDVTIKM